MTCSQIQALKTQLKTLQKASVNSSLPLLPHQKVGLDWIHQCWTANLNGILADEMGLGKTIQTIAFVQSAMARISPVIIVVPLSLLMNWMDEFQKFAPNIKVAAFHGTKEERNNQKLLTPNEAHKLKNPNSLIHKALLSLSVPHKLLLTGTPFQNNLQEMQSLLAFCNPDYFDFDTKEELGKNCITEFAKLVDPLILRRTKERVLDLPDISESIVYTPLTKLQKKVYLSMLSKDYSLFEKKAAGVHNLLVQLQKCSNHPYLFPGVEPEPFTQGEHLVDASGKLLVLDGILQYLKEKDRKVLIFSQMTKMLDIVQDYLDIRGYDYERLDGSIRGEDRNQSVQTFQQNKTFVFLLSTKAGGVGLNLTAADTVIFLDSDFNPSNDRQAAARAHRIGQTKEVKIIRFISPHSVDEYIWRRAQQKEQEGKQFFDSLQKGATVQSKDLLSLFQYGLNTLVNNDEECKIYSKEEIEAIFETKIAVDSEKLADSMVEDIYVYEGKDYKADKVALDLILSQVGKKREFDETEDDDVQQVRAERVKAAQERRQNQRKKLVEKWKSSGYISRNIEDLSLSDGLPYTFDPKVVYTRGDVSRPIAGQNEKCVIAQVVDNSGRWPNGGVFKAISSQDKSVQEYYHSSKAVNNLTLGSAHVVSFKQHKVAILVAQSESQRSTISQSVFGQAFEKVVDYCKKTNSTLHIPRFGENLEKGNWYGLERIINKYADEYEIQVKIYYFKK
ncbi:Chromodomain-helicase-DNA-binding protein 1-like [Boothiomyces macroporosus]|uniref:Chromodomain-helicase-DNA-binding protein 1-like n=1 Tax=Boothiomyces macroporosus TaxID=261099 RepID=A0AAD5Y476_9FUNG|nr:Chromodomain-helicase-DNA-binding protein 1-like [Boothiomyces macroporosus]